MLNTKFDLYKSEWLDLVFDDRNKAYGAYDLRHHYSGTLNKAMGIAFALVITGALALSYAFKSVPKEEYIIHEYVNKDIKIAPPEKPKEVKPETHKATPPAKPAAPVTTTQFITPTITNDPVATDPPKNIELTSEIGAQTIKGTDGPPAIVDNGPVGPSTTGGNDEEIVPSGIGLEVNPEPYGGMAAFGKFLGKALRFPAQAQDAGVSGRVIMSFVIEKNGELSNITVVRGAGYGFDEEAMRVLKLAKAWKPGIQNGQPVRVRYTIPINFQLPTE
ncbi:energy transducer TonB [Mucilaginibacter psychrotolerans]|uniref:Energy transducer TonB n=1 Tax=Mucilaginibacter psychrotolerans TaxID=1524096 RepID=A0A4Y8SL67_9SPHI|nr:energy transducer TonB [Mucilaginibacter psychrotolerans]TFF39783.1 energy transducer TonB [Mucilaginibacter psychrotolerans]